jgi:predicted anti-sigma-YlaC factor YlaD
VTPTPSHTPIRDFPVSGQVHRQPGLIPRAILVLLLSMSAITLLGSCSIRKFVAGGVANSLSSGPDVFSSEDDPELVRDAVPFGLKTMESLLEVVPKHKGLLLALTRGFTQYAYAFVQMDADHIEPADYARATELRDRARRLFVRARDYGLRRMALDYKGIAEQLEADPAAAAKRFRKQDVPVMFWTAAAWGSAINLGKDQPELVANLPAVRALIERAVALDEGYEGGSLHEALILLEALPEAMGGSPQRARQHFDRAIALTGGERPGPFVTFAQSVSVMTQNRAEFRDLLEKAIAIDPNRIPAQRLQTIVTQRRARELLERQDDLFLDDAPSDTTSSGSSDR